MSHNEAVSWLQCSVDLILPGLSVGLMSQYSAPLPSLNGLATVCSSLIRLALRGIAVRSAVLTKDLCTDVTMLCFNKTLCWILMRLILFVYACADMFTLFMRTWTYLFCRMLQMAAEDYMLVNCLAMLFTSVFLRHMMLQNANYPTLFKWLLHFDINYNKCAMVPSYFQATPVATWELGSGPTWEWQQLTCLPSCLAGGNRRDGKSDSKWWVIFRV